MISHLSIKQRHERPNQGHFRFDSRETVRQLRARYRMCRRRGADAWTCRYLITSSLSVGVFHAQYVSSFELQREVVS